MGSIPGKGKEELSFLSWMGEYLGGGCGYLPMLFLKGRYVCSSLFACLYQYTLMSKYYTPWIIVQYHKLDNFSSNHSSFVS